MLKLAHSLKLKAVAEGVESDAQVRLSTLLRCDRIQDFPVRPAVPSADFEDRFVATDGRMV